MYVDAIAFFVSCVRKPDSQQRMSRHCDSALIPKFTRRGELEAIFAPKAARTAARTSRAHVAQGDTLVEELKLSLPARLASMVDGQLVSTRPCPPQPGQGGWNGKKKQVCEWISGHVSDRTVTEFNVNPYTRGEFTGCKTNDDDKVTR